MPLFGVQFNWWLEDVKIVATVGSNRVCKIRECERSMYWQCFQVCVFMSVCVCVCVCVCS